MSLSSLGYVGIRARDLGEWVEYGTRQLGLQLIDRSQSSLAFRMDDRKQRLVVQKEDWGGVAFFGWEVSGSDALDSVCRRLDAAQVPYQRLSRSLCEARFVRDGVVFQDPSGNRLEAFYGPEIAEEGFVPSRAISGFVTGPLGVGHAVLTVDRIDTAIAFYQDVLGFRLSDYVLSPFKAFFFHINPRHHSLALIETGKTGTHHLMMELYYLDDVGQGYDIALTNPEEIGTTLGRHSNDFMTSFYTFTPSGFMIEYGWGGKCIDVETWKPYEMQDGPSLWGHERNWLPEEGRAQARDLRMNAAAKGVREPVYVSAGNHKVSPVGCAWWDNNVRRSEARK
jgi:2,3-dihydroxybiphenyl 1,2-dioxygenase